MVRDDDQAQSAPIPTVVDNDTMQLQTVIQISLESAEAESILPESTRQLAEEG